jgi:hypothetical protein
VPSCGLTSCPTHVAVAAHLLSLCFPSLVPSPGLSSRLLSLLAGPRKMRVTVASVRDVSDRTYLVIIRAGLLKFAGTISPEQMFLTAPVPSPMPQTRPNRRGPPPTPCALELCPGPAVAVVNHHVRAPRACMHAVGLRRCARASASYRRRLRRPTSSR